VKESSIVHDYTQKIVAEEPIRGFDSYKCELLPRPDAAVVWGKLLVWVRKKDYVPLREEYYDEDGTLINVLVYNGIKEMGDRVIPTIMTMIPRNKEGHKTVLVIKKMEFNIAIKDSFFSLKNIKRLR
jgi:outer membrane lipoprotein-sorting protein